MAAIRAPLQYVGPIKRNLQIVDGVVALHLFDYVVEEDGLYKNIGIDEVTIYNDTSSSFDRVAFGYELKDATQYTVKIKAEKILGSSTPRLLVEDYANTSILADIDLLVDNQEYSATFTTIDTGVRLSFYTTRSSAELSEDRFYDFVLYEGTTQPTSGQPVTGNSFLWTDKERTIYPEAARTDRNWNEVDNYDFSDGTDGWASLFQTGSAIDNVYSGTADGTQVESIIRSDSGNLPINMIEGDVWFLFAKVRVTNSEATQIRLRHRRSDGLISVDSVASPNMNQFYELFGLSVSPADYSSPYMDVTQRYIDAATANGKVIEIDGNISTGGGVFALNLTKIDEALVTSYATMTAEEINAIKYKLLGEIWHINTTNAVPEAKLVPITSDSIIWNDQYFWNSPCMLMYNQSFSGDDLTKIQQFMGF